MRAELRQPGELTRRGFLASALALLFAPGAAGQGTDTAAVGRLSHPSAAGRPRAPTIASDNDAEIQAIEKQLRCTCGCTLDIYTCRTTDFSCTYSPALHREVVELQRQGSSAREILDAFVGKYGEEALMAPEPEGFNLAGYVVPGAAVLGLGATLLWVLTHRRSAVARAAAAAPAQPVAATREELAELERALDEDDQ